MLHLDDDTIADLLDLAGVTDAVERALGAWGRGDAASTVRLRASAAGQMASAMAAVVPPYSGGKLYATVAGRFTFLNVLFDAEGRLLCTLDGDAITKLRTAAATAVAVRCLRPDVVTRAAVIGAGRQGVAHAKMLLAELPDLTELAVYARNQKALASLATEIEACCVTAVITGTANDAVDGSSVIVTATASRDPLFDSGAVASTALVCAVGATKYDRCEISSELVARCAAVVCDDVEGSKVECGDLIHAAAKGRFDWNTAIELRDVVAGSATVGRPTTRPVLFESQGIALQDVAAAGLAYERHLRKDAPT